MFTDVDHGLSGVTNRDRSNSLIGIQIADLVKTIRSFPLRPWTGAKEGTPSPTRNGVSKIITNTAILLQNHAMKYTTTSRQKYAIRGRTD